jgi:GH24 family phage-related lysozyme (muramidase)
MTNSKLLPNVLKFSSHKDSPNYSSRSKEEFEQYSFSWLSHPDHENIVKHMYPDSKGIITIGIGHAIPNTEAVKKLPFYFRKPITPPRDVTDKDKIDEYDKLKAIFIRLMKNVPPGNSSVFRNATNLDLAEEAVKDLFEEDLKKFLRQLEQTFPHYNEYPDEAKLGLLDMIYNLGHAGLTGKFPKLVRAAKMGDWSTVAKECRRNGIGNKRNENTKELFEKAEKAVETIKASQSPVLLADGSLEAEKSFPDLWS